MNVEFSARTDVGRSRSQNEDNFLIDRKLQLYIVCDGMGGHASGEVASATAVNVVRETLLKQRDLIEAYRRREPTVTERDVCELLTTAVQTANARIYERGMMTPSQRGMGTTLSLLMLLGDRGFIAHVGDSRVYRLRKQVPEQVTRDHSFYEEVLAKQLGPEGAHLAAQYKNAITRAVGVHQMVEVDTYDFELQPGDRFMICSDGLHGYFDDDPEALTRLLTLPDLDAATEGMIDFANGAGGKDNITVIIVQIPAAQATAGASEHFARLRAMPLFRHLTDTEVLRLIAACQPRRFEPDEVIFEDEAPTDGMYIVEEGQVVIAREGRLISRIGPGQYVGSITVLDGGARSAGARASSQGPVQLLAMSREAFNDILLNEPSLGVKLLWGIARSLAARLRTATERIVASSARVTPGTISGNVDFDDPNMPESWLDTVRASSPGRASDAAEAPARPATMPDLPAVDPSARRPTSPGLPAASPGASRANRTTLPFMQALGATGASPTAPRATAPDLPAVTPPPAPPASPTTAPAGDGRAGRRTTLPFVQALDPSDLPRVVAPAGEPPPRPLADTQPFMQALPRGQAPGAAEDGPASADAGPDPSASAAPTGPTLAGADEAGEALGSLEDVFDELDALMDEDVEDDDDSDHGRTTQDLDLQDILEALEEARRGAPPPVPPLAPPAPGDAPGAPAGDAPLTDGAD